MTDLQTTDDVVVAEAAAWIARLQGSERTPAAEAAFKEWLGADAAHARAFSRATDVWELIPGAAAYGASGTADLRHPSMARRSVPLGLAAAAAIVIVIAGGVFYQLRAPTYVTAVGQQQTVTLDDGTRVSLNTDSQLQVRYAANERRLVLKRGEGLFQVAKDPIRPFIVEVGADQVRALGTSFIIRKDPSVVAVTLIEGKVEIRRQGRVLADIPDTKQENRPVYLAPGQRLTLKDDAPRSLDKPKLEALVAWQRGEVMFDDVSLVEAAAEINRYGKLHVVIAERELSRLRVSGVFETRDPQEFAYAMAQLHRLAVTWEGTEIVLSARKMSGSLN